MKFLPFVIYLICSIATIESLQKCFECHALLGRFCPSERTECTAGQDVCLSMYVHTAYEGKQSVEIIKRCGKSSECERTGTIHSSTVNISINTTCCHTHACIPPTPTKPVFNTEKNGVMCPSCFSRMAVGCLDKGPVECTGDENYCIHYKSQVTQEHLILSESLHGCTTANICTAGSSLVKYQWKIMKMDIKCFNGSNNLHINTLLFFFTPLSLTILFFRFYYLDLM